MRARDPDRDGFADHDGTRVFYEVFGAGEPTLVLVPSNPIVHSRQWKAQVPYLSRHYRVVTLDGRGNGRSDRPVAPEVYTEEAYLAELAAVLDATGSDRVVLSGCATTASGGRCGSPPTTPSGWPVSLPSRSGRR